MVLVSTITGGTGVKVPFTWKVTGRFMVGWSPEFYDVPPMVTASA